MKLVLQIFFFLITWFNVSATPAYSKVTLPNYAVSFPKAESQNQESEVKIGVSNFARSGILENSFSQKAVLWESSVLENRAREGNVNVVKGAGKLAQSLTGALKNTYDDLLKAGYKVSDDGISIIFKNVDDLPIAKISDDALHIKIPDNHGGGGWAKQSNTSNATTALSKINNGDPLYRIGTLNHSAAAEAQYWSLENPANITDIKLFAQKYGIPEANLKNGDFFIEIGKPKANIPKISREAPGVGGNVGGNIEIVVPVSGVKLKSFHTIKF